MEITITVPTPIAIRTNTDSTENIITKADITGTNIIETNATITGVITGGHMTAIAITDRTEVVLMEGGIDTTATDSCKAGSKSNNR